MVYIATFFSHFGAIRYKKECEKKGYQLKLMPVPRNLSSSCGTCVRYEADTYCPLDSVPEEVEQIVQIEENGYLQQYLAKDC